MKFLSISIHDLSNPYFVHTRLIICTRSMDSTSFPLCISLKILKLNYQWGKVALPSIWRAAVCIVGTRRRVECSQRTSCHCFYWTSLHKLFVSRLRIEFWRCSSEYTSFVCFYAGYRFFIQPPLALNVSIYYRATWFLCNFISIVISYSTFLVTHCNCLCS